LTGNTNARGTVLKKCGHVGVNRGACGHLMIPLVIEIATRFAAVGRPGGPTVFMVQRAAMKAGLTPLTFIVKQPCSMAE
jgi:hypothetical protein